MYYLNISSTYIPCKHKITLVDNTHYRSWYLALSYLSEGQAILENQN
jgi:hypothetical protein